MKLSSHGMKIVWCGGTINYLHIMELELFFQSHFLFLITCVIRKLQESFDTSLTVLWSLSVHSMGKRKNNAGLLSPFSLSTNDEIINSDGCSIGKITKLSFPDDQAVGIGGWVAVLKAKHSILTQMTVGNSDVVRYWFEEAVFLHISFLITDESVSMWESASLDILTWNSHCIAFIEKSGPG